MKIEEQWKCWTLCAKKNKTRTGGEKGRHLWPPLVQKVVDGIAAYELSWEVKVMIKNKKEKKTIHHTHGNEAIFDKLHNQIDFILHWNQVKFDPHTEIKSICTTHAKWKSVFMLTPKTSDYRTSFNNQVNVDCPLNDQIIFILTLKSSQIRSPTLKSSQIRSPTLKSRQFVPPTQKNKLCFILIQKRTDFRTAYK